MQNKILSPVLLMFFTLLTTAVMQAQEAVLTTYGDADSPEGSVSYSVGQVAFITNSGTEGILTEGVQQPFELFFIQAIQEYGEPGLECSVFPNPVIKNATLKIDMPRAKEMEYELYSMLGALILKKGITGTEMSIPMEGLEPATYYLLVREENKTIRSFKILKQ